VREQRLTTIVLARSEEHGGDEGGDAGVDVDYRAAREVQRAEIGEPPSAPNPVANGRIHAQRPGADEDQVWAEAHALDDRAGD
jgi:hypothetical protein